MTEGPKFYYANIPKQKTPNHTYASAGVILEGNVFWDMFQTGNVAYNDGNREAIWTINTSLEAWIAGDRTARLSYSRCFAPSIRESLPGILDGTIPKEQEDVYLRSIRDETRRLARLVRTMLDESRTKAAAVDPKRRTDFDLTELIVQTLLSFESRANEKNLDVDP